MNLWDVEKYVEINKTIQQSRATTAKSILLTSHKQSNFQMKSTHTPKKQRLSHTSHVTQSRALRTAYKNEQISIKSHPKTPFQAII